LSAHVKPQLRAEIVADIKKHIDRTKMKLGKILLLYGIKMNTYRNWFNSSDEVISERKKRESALSAVLPEEKEAVKEFRLEHQDVGYRKLTWMMIDSGKAYLPETSVYRLLHEFGMIHMGTVKTYAEDEYKNKPKYVHHHWHTDIAYIKVGNIHYYLIMLLDGYSRFILDWELMTDMTEQSVSLFVQRVKEKYPYCNPMLIMDNGSQFISKDFKTLISRINIKPVHTRRNHPQTNGKIERLNGIVKNEAVKKYYPQSYSEACRILNDYVYEYNYARLHSGINYLRPSDMFFGRDKNILNERKSKLMLAKKCRVAKNKERMEFAS